MATCLDRAKCINTKHFPSPKYCIPILNLICKKLAATGLLLPGSTEGVKTGSKAFLPNVSRQEIPAQLLPFDMSFAESCRTSSGILSHWHSERHRSISVSSREPDFLAVILASGLDQTKTPQEQPSLSETGPSKLAW